MLINSEHELYNYILPDNYAAGHAVAKHLYNNGHRRIMAALVKPELPGEFHDRFAGAMDFLRSKNLLDEQEQRELNARLCALADHIQEHPEVRIRYFVPNERKSGGAIVEVCGAVKKLVAADKTIVLDNGTVIPIYDLLNIAPDKPRTSSPPQV